MFRICNATAFELSVLYEPSGEVLPATLRGLGCNEALVALDVELSDGEQVRLSLRHAETELQLDLQASVRACQREPSGKWGCEVHFATPIAEHAMSQLAGSGALERRRFSRQPFHLPVLVQWEYDANDCPAFLWNISEGGFCLVCPRKPGRKATVFTDRSETRITVRTRWQTKTGGGYVIGCEFASADSYEQMLAWRPRPHDSRPQGVERRQAVTRTFRDLVARVITSGSAAPVGKTGGEVGSEAR